MSLDRALVLDFGGVISKTLFEDHARNEAALGLEAGTLTWMGPFDPSSDPLWVKMQNDEISERDYWRLRTREVSELAGRHWSEMSDFVRAVRGDECNAIIRPEATQLVHEVKQAGTKLAILSNELDLFYGEGFTARWDFFDAFDAVVDGTYTGVLKPDIRAYTNCAETLGVAPADCVFIDDQLRNVRGGMQAGMMAVHLNVTQPGDAFTRAKQLLFED